MVVGAVFLLFEILGFIPGITTNYGALSGAGHHSRGKLLGIFPVCYLHTAVHLLSPFDAHGRGRAIEGFEVFTGAGGDGIDVLFRVGVDAMT